MSRPIGAIEQEPQTPFIDREAMMMDGGRLYFQLTTDDSTAAGGGRTGLVGFMQALRDQFGLSSEEIRQVVRANGLSVNDNPLGVQVAIGAGRIITWEGNQFRTSNEPAPPSPGALPRTQFPSERALQDAQAALQRAQTGDIAAQQRLQQEQLTRGAFESDRDFGRGVLESDREFTEAVRQFDGELRERIADRQQRLTELERELANARGLQAQRLETERNNLLAQLSNDIQITNLDARSRFQIAQMETAVGLRGQDVSRERTGLETALGIRGQEIGREQFGLDLAARRAEFGATNLGNDQVRNAIFTLGGSGGTSPLELAAQQFPTLQVTPPTFEEAIGQLPPGSMPTVPGLEEFLAMLPQEAPQITQAPTVAPVPSFAHGGTLPQKGDAIVGEQGPELIRDGRQVIPLNQFTAPTAPRVPQTSLQDLLGRRRFSLAPSASTINPGSPTPIPDVREPLPFTPMPRPAPIAPTGGMSSIDLNRLLGRPTEIVSGQPTQPSSGFVITPQDQLSPPPLSPDQLTLPDGRRIDLSTLLPNETLRTPQQPQQPPGAAPQGINVITTPEQLEEMFRTLPELDTPASRAFLTRTLARRGFIDPGQLDPTLQSRLTVANTLRRTLTGQVPGRFGGIARPEPVFGVDIGLPGEQAARFPTLPQAAKDFLLSAFGVRGFDVADVFRRMRAATPVSFFNPGSVRSR